LVGLCYASQVYTNIDMDQVLLAGQFLLAHFSPIFRFKHANN